MAFSRRIHIAATLIGSMALVLGGPAIAGAQEHPEQRVHVRCGQTITQDATLANDLHDCHGIGLVVGADDVTLDLGGHVVDGDGISDFAGIQSIGHDHVTIRNGSVREFVENVAVLDTTGTTISDLEITRARHVGVFVDGGDAVLVRRTTSRDIAFSAVFVTRSARTRVLDNVVTDSGGGVGTRASHDLVLAGNTVSSSSGAGIGLFDDVQRVQVVDNTVTGGHDAGLFIDGDQTTVARNVVSKNADNVVVTGDHTIVVDNLISKARGFRGDPLSGFGIVVDGGHDDLVAHNAISDSAGDGIRLFQFDPEAAQPQSGLVVRANRVAGSGLDGIFVGPDIVGGVIADNETLGNRDDGIDDESPSSTLAGNSATGNGDLGIEAVPGVTDGGGNTASGNGNPLQCTNVLCG